MSSESTLSSEEARDLSPELSSLSVSASQPPETATYGGAPVSDSAVPTVRIEGIPVVNAYALGPISASQARIVSRCADQAAHEEIDQSPITADRIVSAASMTSRMVTG